MMYNSRRDGYGIPPLYQLILIVGSVGGVILLMNMDNADLRSVLLLLFSGVLLCGAFLLPIVRFFRKEERGWNEIVLLIATEISLALFTWGFVQLVLKSNPAFFEYFIHSLEQIV